MEARHWYGLFDYGDVMHTYDPMRHCWKYDVGGYAWQNTELVPTYWLWLYFLHTGREDVFSLAEAMSRHASEVDTYHSAHSRGWVPAIMYGTGAAPAKNHASAWRDTTVSCSI